MKKIKYVLFFLLILLDITLIPWLLVFPIYFQRYGFSASSHWIALFLILPKFLIDFFKDGKLFKIWLAVQPIIAILSILLLTNKRAKFSNGKDGIGGPNAAGSGQHGTSRWQTEKETDSTTTVWNISKPQPKKGGIVLGMKNTGNDKKVWLSTDDTHNLIIGTTRSGKTRKCIMPTIWELAKTGESMVLSDPKGELYDRTSKYLKDNGYEIVLVDFRNPRRGNRWNLIKPVVDAVRKGKNGDINEMAIASEYAWDIAHAIVYQRPQTGEPIWADGAESVIASLILLTAMEADEDNKKHMTSVYQTLYTLGCCSEDEDFPPIVDYINSLPASHPARAAFAAATLAPGRTRASFFTGVAASLRLFADPSIAYLTSVQDHNLADVGKRKTAVFLIIPDERATRHVLASLYIDQTYQALVDLANENRGRLPIRVNFILDEFGNLPAITDFDKKITVAGGRGMRFTLVIQDLGQLKERYKASAQTITGNCHTWVYILTTDIETAKVISQKTGRYTVETESYSSQIRGHDVSSGSSHNLAGRELLLPDEILRWPDEMALVLRARQYPARLPMPDLSKWPADRELTFIDDNLIDKKEFRNDVEIWTPNIFEDDFDDDSIDKKDDHNVLDSI